VTSITVKRETRQTVTGVVNSPLAIFKNRRGAGPGLKKKNAAGKAGGKLDREA
jgi:hypothetical protein